MEELPQQLGSSEMRRRTTVSLLTSTFLAWISSSGVQAENSIHAPKNRGAANSDQPTIYWEYNPGADFYVVHGIGPNSTLDDCDGATAFLSLQKIDSVGCGYNMSDDVVGDLPSGKMLCHWTVPYRLSEGNYAVQVNAYNLEAPALNFNPRSACASSRTASPAGYQKFYVKKASVRPEKVGIVGPVNGLSCGLLSGGGGRCTPLITVEPTATWYQIWIEDRNGVVLNSRWYTKSEMMCYTVEGIAYCSFPDQKRYLNNGSPYHWWARNWNSAGAGSWVGGRDGIAFSFVE